MADTYPIHPTVLVALPFLFRQLAQNERSLFAFLHTDEPWALRDVTAMQGTSDGLPIYRLTHLYAYVEANLSPGLFGKARGKRWAELAEARAALGSDDPTLLDVLTVIGVLNAIERAQVCTPARLTLASLLPTRPTTPSLSQLCIRSRSDASSHTAGTATVSSSGKGAISTWRP